MSTPFHTYASRALPAAPSAAHALLREAPERLVTSATAAALAAMTPLARAWGLSATRLPTVTARPTGDDELGSIEVTWTGEPRVTAWPSLTGRLVVDERPGAAHRLSFLSRRSPVAELSTTPLGRLHQRRLVQVAVQGFLSELVRELTPRIADAATPAPAVAGDVDQAPLFVHDLRVLGAEPGRVLAHLTNDPQALARRTTDAVVEELGDALAAGRFRAPPAPAVHVEVPAAGEVGALRIGWHSDEEATGWPAMHFAVVVEPHDRGTRLALLSAREPRYDLSVNRVDKRQRHDVLQHVGGAVARALTVELASPALVAPAAAR
jgi:hypothetical protein